MLDDELEATASEDYRGEKSGLYTITVRNRQGELVAMFRGRSVSRDEPILDED